jgi:hypothetical protein
LCTINAQLWWTLAGLEKRSTTTKCNAGAGLVDLPDFPGIVKFLGSQKHLRDATRILFSRKSPIRLDRAKVVWSTKPAWLLKKSMVDLG